MIRKTPGTLASRTRQTLVSMLAVVLGALCSGCSATIRPATIADAQTAARVKTAIVNDSEIGEFAIEVRVVDGIAILSGRVRSRLQLEKAVNLARAVPGVVDVKPELQLGGDPVALPATPVERTAPGFLDAAEIDTSPNLLALGVAVGWSIPSPAALKTRVAVSPFIKLGSPNGLGPAIAFDWFHANLEPIGGPTPLARVHVKPIMAGIGYTLAGNRFSLAPSIVAGYAFNSLTLNRTGVVAEGLPVEVANSFVWRIGASTWVDLSRRVGVIVSTGYLLTGLRFTIVERGRLERRHQRGDTTILHMGVAYRWF